MRDINEIVKNYPRFFIAYCTACGRKTKNKAVKERYCSKTGKPIYRYYSSCPSFFCSLSFRGVDDEWLDFLEELNNE